MPHRHNKTSAIVLLLTGIVIGLCVHRWGVTHAQAADAKPAPAAGIDELVTLRADVARLKSIATDQSHTMADVAYHFTNLWFAGKAENWPLAQFYSDELRSHLRWAVRVIPMRKDRDGRDVDLTAILAALEQSSLKDLSDSVKARDPQRFAAAYNAQMQNCMACHRAAGKEYLTLHVPDRPDAGIVDFAPAPGAK